MLNITASLQFLHKIPGRSITHNSGENPHLKRHDTILTCTKILHDKIEVWSTWLSVKNWK